MGFFVLSQHKLEWTERLDIPTHNDSFQQHTLHRFSFNPGSQRGPHIERMHKYIDSNYSCTEATV